MANPAPELWFVPSDTTLHPETREPVAEEAVAYSIKAVRQMMAETGIDYIDGRIVSLECARFMRQTGGITRYVMLESEQ